MNIIKQWNGKTIRFRESDNYGCLTDMAQATGKLVADWLRLKSTKEYLESFSAVMEKPITELLDVIQGGVPEQQGTWAERKICLRFAQWCDTDLAVRVDIWLFDELLPSIRKTGLFNATPFKLSQDSSLVSFEFDDYWVCSNSIAEVFGKRHDNVLRDLESAMSDLLKFEEMSDNLPNFKLVESTYLDSYNRATKCYKVNRSLFNYVVLAYQGDNAKLYRMKFIQAFDELERQVKVFLSQQMIYSNPKRQQVYILQNSISGMVKIGITNDINRRIAELQNASGCEINILYLSPKTDNAKEIEQELHKQFIDYRGIGEWFNLPPNVAIEELTKKELIVNPNNIYSRLLLGSKR